MPHTHREGTDAYFDEQGTPRAGIANRRVKAEIEDRLRTNHGRDARVFSNIGQGGPPPIMVFFPRKISRAFSGPIVHVGSLGAPPTTTPERGIYFRTGSGGVDAIKAGGRGPWKYSTGTSLKRAYRVAGERGRRAWGARHGSGFLKMRRQFRRSLGVQGR